MKTKGQFEAEISEAIIKFEKDFMGRGPLEIKTHILDDLIVARLKNVLTPAEHKLAEIQGNGRTLVKQMRIELLEKGRPLLEEAIQTITNVRVISLHTDISTKTGERIIVFTLEQKINFKE